MLAIEFLRTAHSAEPRPLYVLSGDDAFLRGESIAAIVRKVLGDGADDFSVSRFPGESASLADVLDELRTLPFLAKARVVIVENADPFVTAHRRELELYAEKPASTGVLILSVKSWPANTKLAKLVEKVGVSVECKAPAAKDLPRWLVGLAKSRAEATLDPDAADLLVDLVGPEVGLLAMEVEKLAVYVGATKKIRREDVATMVGSGRTQEIWDAIADAASGEGQKALVALDSLFAANEAPQRVIGAFGMNLLKVYKAGTLRKAGRDAKDACKEAGVFWNAVEPTIRQHAHLGPDRVERLPETLLRTDLDTKGGSQLPPRTVVERLVAEFSLPRKD